MNAVAASQAVKGELVSTVSSLGGIGLARSIDGNIFISGGNGWYYPPFAGDLQSVHYDGGALYYDALSGVRAGEGQHN